MQPLSISYELRTDKTVLFPESLMLMDLILYCLAPCGMPVNGNRAGPWHQQTFARLPLGHTLLETRLVTPCTPHSALRRLLSLK